MKSRIAVWIARVMSRTRSTSSRPWALALDWRCCCSPVVPALTAKERGREQALLSPPISAHCACCERGAHLTRCRARRSEEHTSELQSRGHLVCRLLLVKKNEYLGQW